MGWGFCWGLRWGWRLKGWGLVPCRGSSGRGHCSGNTRGCACPCPSTGASANPSTCACTCRGSCGAAGRRHPRGSQAQQVDQRCARGGLPSPVGWDHGRHRSGYLLHAPTRGVRVAGVGRRGCPVVLKGGPSGRSTSYATTMATGATPSCRRVRVCGKGLGVGPCPCPRPGPSPDNPSGPCNDLHERQRGLQLGLEVRVPGMVRVCA